MSQTGKTISLNIIKDALKKHTTKGLSSYKSRYKALTMNDYSKLPHLYNKTSTPLSTIRPRGYTIYTKTLKNHSLKLDKEQAYLANVVNSVGGLRMLSRRSVMSLHKTILANQENEKLKSGSWLYSASTGKFVFGNLGFKIWRTY